MRLLLFLCVAVAIAGAACGGDDEEGAGAPSPSALFGTIVRYDTADAVHVVAELVLPEQAEPAPAIILLHQLNGSRAQWQPLVEPLLDAGYAVLAPDLRAFGDTRCGDGEQCTFEGPEQLVQDVGAAIDFLSGREGVDAERIAVIGASIGGTAAYFASGSFDEVDTTIAMSPILREPQDGLPGARKPFAPRSVLFLTDENEAEESRGLEGSVEAPVEIKVYPGAQAHGVQLLQNQQVIQDILDWLEANL